MQLTLQCRYSLIDGALNGWPVLLFVAALLLLIALYVKKDKGAFF